jgi:hypothetical protein
MIYTGEGLRVRICTYPTVYHHWMSFVCYSSMRRFLPDAEVELAVFGRPGFFYDWAARLRLRTLRRPPVLAAPLVEAESGMLAITSECVAVSQWENDIFLTESLVNQSGTACLRHNNDFVISNTFCEGAKFDGYVPLVNVSEGVGSFVSKDWIDKSTSFLTNINRFKTGKETQMELAVLEEWQRAIVLASSLGLNR